MNQCFILLLSPILDSVPSVAESRKRPNQSTSDSSDSKQFKEDDSTHGMFLLCTNYCSYISDSSVLYIWCTFEYSNCLLSTLYLTHLPVSHVHHVTIGL